MVTETARWETTGLPFCAAAQIFRVYGPSAPSKLPSPCLY